MASRRPSSRFKRPRAASFERARLSTQRSGAIEGGGSPRLAGDVDRKTCRAAAREAFDHRAHFANSLPRVDHLGVVARRSAATTRTLEESVQAIVGLAGALGGSHGGAANDARVAAAHETGAVTQLPERVLDALTRVEVADAAA